MRFHLALLGALALIATHAHAQEAPPAVFTGLAGTTPIAAADREHAGERAIGDVVAENARAYTRTARLATAYAANIQGEPVALPAGTPFIASYAGIMIRPADAAERRIPEAASGTIIWCALPASGYAPCFFWDANAGVHAQALMTGGAPSTRGWLGNATPAPMPDIAMEDANLPPRQTRILLNAANAEGYILQVVTEEAGVTYTQTYPRRAWDAWHYIFLAPHQRMRATPVLDAAGAVRGANVAFTREPPAAAGN